MRPIRPELVVLLVALLLVILFVEPGWPLLFAAVLLAVVILTLR